MHGRMECCFKSCMNPQVCFLGLAGSICKQRRSYSFVMRYTLTVSTKPMFEPIRASLGDC